MDEHFWVSRTHRPATWQVHAVSHGACTPSVSEGPLLHRLPTLAALCCQPPEDVGWNLSGSGVVFPEVQRPTFSLGCAACRSSASAGASPSCHLPLSSLCSPVRVVEGAGRAFLAVQTWGWGLAPEPGLGDPTPGWTPAAVCVRQVPGMFSAPCSVVCEARGLQAFFLFVH